MPEPSSAVLQLIRTEARCFLEDLCENTLRQRGSYRVTTPDEYVAVYVAVRGAVQELIEEVLPDCADPEV